MSRGRRDAGGDAVVDPGTRVPRWRLVQPTAVAWLTVVWLVLWRELSWWNLLSGIVVGTLVSLVFPLPRLRMRLRVRPGALLWLAVKFHVDLVLASWQVTKRTLSRRPLVNAVIKVPLRTSSDFVLTLTAEMVSLVPGSVVVEASRAEHTLYIHVLDAPDEAAVGRARRSVLAQEARLVRALGADTAPVEREPGGIPLTPTDRPTGGPR